MECKEALEIVRLASQKHKDKKNFKKKWFKYLKRTKITDSDIEKKKALLSHISVVIMAKNAEQTIAETLDALKSFDEVVIYLNNSTDKTKEIAQSYPNVNIIEGNFLGFGPTKNEASKYAKHDWILSLDSDEILNPALINEIMALDFSDITKLYKLKRNNYFLGHKTQHINLIVRMYHKKHTSFDDSMVHEKIIIPKNTKVLTLKHSFKHLYILTVNQTLHKIIHYTDLGSHDKKTCFFIVVIAKSIFAFFKTYILQGNISKGWVGYVLAVNSANKRHYKYLKQYINCLEEKKKS
jgi:glycosyltransferase involved in cell wall biosynthesis